MKPAWQSKTLWLNLILALTAMFYPPANDYLQANPQIVAVGFSVINMILRLVTKDQLQLQLTKKA